MTPRTIVALLLASGGVLAACSNDVENVVDDAREVKDRATACTEALGIATSWRPADLDPDQLVDQAQQKAGQLRDVAERVGEDPLRESLFGLADLYVEVKRHEVDGLAGVNDWVQRNAEHLDDLRHLCL